MIRPTVYLNATIFKLEKNANRVSVSCTDVLQVGEQSGPPRAVGDVTFSIVDTEPAGAGVINSLHVGDRLVIKIEN